MNKKRVKMSIPDGTDEVSLVMPKDNAVKPCLRDILPLVHGRVSVVAVCKYESDHDGKTMTRSAEWTVFDRDGELMVEKLEKGIHPELLDMTPRIEPGEVLPTLTNGSLSLNDSPFTVFVMEL